MEAVIEQLSDYERERGKPMPTLNHSIVQGNLNFALQLHYRSTYRFLPEINLTMPERPDAVPDIAIYPKLQADFLHDVTSMMEMPLTVIEIISPSQSNEDILTKFERYFNAGVQSCWLVMPVFKLFRCIPVLANTNFLPKTKRWPILSLALNLLSTRYLHSHTWKFSVTTLPSKRFTMRWAKPAS